MLKTKLFIINYAKFIKFNIANPKLKINDIYRRRRYELNNNSNNKNNFCLVERYFKVTNIQYHSTFDFDKSYDHTTLTCIEVDSKKYKPIKNGKKQILYQDCIETILNNITILYNDPTNKNNTIVYEDEYAILQK